MMRAVVAHGAGDLRVEQRPVPAAGPGEVTVAVRYGGICGSDLHYWRHGAVGEFRLREPLVLGHEVVGHIRSAGPGVELAEGTPVAVHPARPCGACRPCLTGQANVCAEGGYLGSAARFPHVQGGFADVLVAPADRVVPVPDGLDLRSAAIAEPASVAWHAVGQARSWHGDLRGARVLVTGAGPIGLLVVAALKAAGAAEIVVTDLHARPLSVAIQLGATTTRVVGSAEDDAELDVDVSIESSGSAPGLRTCVNGTRRGGTLVGLGMMPPGDTPVAVNAVISRELRVIGSFRFDRELAEVIGQLAAGRLNTGPVVSHVLPVAELRDAFELAADPARSGKVLLEFGAS